jgi:hypothetical protein
MAGPPLATGTLVEVVELGTAVVGTAVVVGTTVLVGAEVLVGTAVGSSTLV